MMGALFQNSSFRITQKGQYVSDPTNYDHHLLHCFVRKPNRLQQLVYCDGKEKSKSLAIRSSSTDLPASLVSSERSSVLINGNGSAAGSNSGLVHGLNGKSGPVKKLLLGQEQQEGLGIIKFLKGKSFFITGSTGFLAKVLIEKLLRTEPDVGKIYVLIKAKDMETAMKRLKDEVINLEIFKCLQQVHGKSYERFMLSKMVPVVGNVCEPNLGMDMEAMAMVVEDVDIIVNSAANTSFHERYDVAINVNTRGPGHVMSFAKNCKKLKLFLQVSTAYVNGQRKGIVMEKAFRDGDSILRENLNVPDLDVESEIRLALSCAESYEEGNCNANQKMKELGLERARKYGWQDTYVFTKAMGEMLVNSLRRDVPVVVLRPSIIESTYKDPFPGWIEGNRMVDPVITLYGNGSVAGFVGDPNAIMDIIPADMVVNATLAAITKHGRSGEAGISVYHVASSVVNPITFGHLGNLVYNYFKTTPLLDSKGRPVKVEPFKCYRSIEHFSSDVWRRKMQQISNTAASSQVVVPVPVPVPLISSSSSTTPTTRLLMDDTIKDNDDEEQEQEQEQDCSLSTKRKNRLERMSRKHVEQTKLLALLYKPYTFYAGRFDNTSTQSLIQTMSEEERKTFHFDVGTLDWEDYLMNSHAPGLRKHVTKA